MAVLLDKTLEQYIILATELAALRTTASLSFWIKTTDAGTTVNPYDSPCVAGIEISAQATDIFWGYVPLAGTIGFARGNGTFTSTTVINDDAWHHVLLTWDSPTGAIEIIVDGVSETTGTSETGDVPGANSFDGLGRMDHGDGVSQIYLDGSLADVRVYDRILTEAEGQTIFASNGHDAINDHVHRWTMDDANEGAFALSVADRSNTPNDGATSGVAALVFEVDQFAAGPDRIDLDGAEGDQTAIFVVGFAFVISGATNPANDGNYTVQSSTFSGGETKINTNENVTTNESGSAAQATSLDTRAVHAESPLDFRRRVA